MNQILDLKLTEDLKDFLYNLRFKKIFILTGKKSFFVSGANKIITPLIKGKIYKIYFKKKLFPEINELKEIIDEIRKFNPDLIVAVGGGAVMDYAKSANCLENNSELSEDIVNFRCRFKKKAKLCAIPTTAGSGAEVTDSAVIYVNKTKYSVEDKSLKPDSFFLIPKLVIGNPKKLKSCAGFDAISQSIESIISAKSDTKSLFFAKKSLKLSFKNYLNFVKRPNLENSTNMCIAANLSGKAISITRTTAPHAISYPFSSLYNVSHGHAVSLTLNQFLKFNYNFMKFSRTKFDLNSRYKILFKISNTNSIYELDKYLNYLKKNTGLEGSLKKLNINIKKDFNKIIKGVNLLRLSNNPVQIEKKDLKEILYSIN